MNALSYFSYGQSNYESRWGGRSKARWARRFRQDDQFIKAIMYANVIMFILSLLVDPQLLSSQLNPFSLLSPSSKSLLLLGGTGTIAIGQFGRWWTLISANYLHGGLLHIFFNMMALHQIGPLIIQEYGSSRMFAIYTLSGIFGFFISYLAGISFTIGASAAVCGLIGAALFYGKSRGGSYGQAIYSQVMGWVISIFVFGLIVPGINNWGHGGGILGGILFGFLLGYEEKRQEASFHRVLGSICLIGTAIVLAWAVISGLSAKFRFLY